MIRPNVNSMPCCCISLSQYSGVRSGFKRSEMSDGVGLSVAELLLVLESSWADEEAMLFLFGCEMLVDKREFSGLDGRHKLWWLVFWAWQQTPRVLA